MDTTISTRQLVAFVVNTKHSEADRAIARDELDRRQDAAAAVAVDRQPTDRDGEALLTPDGEIVIDQHGTPLVIGGAVRIFNTSPEVMRTVIAFVEAGGPAGTTDRLRLTMNDGKPARANLRDVAAVQA